MSKLLIYDTDCPLCRAYTKGLVVTGALPAENRVPSHAITDKTLIDQLDPVRRRHEIPFIDTETGEAHYGVDAILTATQRTWPRFSRFVRDTVLFESGRVFYAFISYNRRLLFPTPPDRPHVMDLTPDFNVLYRLVFLLVLFGTVLTGHLAAVGYVAPLALGRSVVTALVGHLLLTSTYIVRHSTDNRLANLLDYAGHLGMSILVGGAIKSVGFALDWPLLMLLGNAVIIWQHLVRLRTMLLPDWLTVPFTLFVFANA